MKRRMDVDVCVHVTVERAQEGDVNRMCTDNSVHPPSTKTGAKVASFQRPVFTSLFVFIVS